MKNKPTSSELDGGGRFRDPLMREPRPPVRSQRSLGLRKVTLIVPEGCAEGLRDLARVLRARQRERTAEPPFGWRRVSPSAELMVDPERGVRCAIRDTGAVGPDRYHWTVAVFGEPEPMAAGRSGELGEARSQVEAALAATAREDETRFGTPT
jgi:hypothetical protein